MKKYSYLIIGCLMWIVAVVLTDRLYNFEGSTCVAIHEKFLFRMFCITLLSGLGSRSIQKASALISEKNAVKYSFLI